MNCTTRLKIGDINKNFICVLCRGYYIDATTIIECLHSFCRTCIVTYLKTSKTCPVCDTTVHKTRPHQNIRSDKLLQDLVYKLIPGLYKDEMSRRREFYTSHYEAAPKRPGEERGDEMSDRFAYTEEEKISLALHFCPEGAAERVDFRRVFTTKEDLRARMEKRLKAAVDVRYLHCKAAVTIGHLKKFVRLKYGLPLQFQVDMFYNDEPLRNSCTLCDVAYFFNWTRRVPLILTFSVFECSRQQLSRKEYNYLTKNTPLKIKRVSRTGTAILPGQSVTTNTETSSLQAACVSTTPILTAGTVSSIKTACLDSTTELSKSANLQSPSRASAKNSKSKSQSALSASLPPTAGLGKQSTRSGKQLISSSKPFADSSKQLTDSSNQFNGPSMGLSDPSKQLSDQSKQLSDPSKQLSDASKQLSDPSKQLSDPSKQLSDPSLQSVSPSTQHGILNNEQTCTRNQPAGTSNQPTGTNNQPASTSNQPAGTNNQPAGTNNQTAGQTVRPAGTSKKHAGRIKQHISRSKQSAGRSKHPADLITQAADLITQSAVPSTQTAVPSMQLTSSSTQLTGPSTQPAGPCTQPAGPSKQPYCLSTQHACFSTQPACFSSQPVDPSKQSADPSNQPTDPNKQPADPNKQPADPNKQPADPNKQPACPSTNINGYSKQSSASSKQNAGSNSQIFGSSRQSSGPSKHPPKTKPCSLGKRAATTPVLIAPAPAKVPALNSSFINITKLIKQKSEQNTRDQNSSRPPKLVSLLPVDLPQSSVYKASSITDPSKASPTITFSVSSILSAVASRNGIGHTSVTSKPSSTPDPTHGLTSAASICTSLLPSTPSVHHTCLHQLVSTKPTGNKTSNNHQARRMETSFSSSSSYLSCSSSVSSSSVSVSQSSSADSVASPTPAASASPTPAAVPAQQSQTQGSDTLLSNSIISSSKQAELARIAGTKDANLTPVYQADHIRVSCRTPTTCETRMAGKDIVSLRAQSHSNGRVTCSAQRVSSCGARGRSESNVVTTSSRNTVSKCESTSLPPIAFNTVFSSHTMHKRKDSESSPATSPTSNGSNSSVSTTALPKLNKQKKIADIANTLHKRMSDALLSMDSKRSSSPSSRRLHQPASPQLKSFSIPHTHSDNSSTTTLGRPDFSVKQTLQNVPPNGHLVSNGSSSHNNQADEPLNLVKRDKDIVRFANTMFILDIPHSVT